jgi:hypothetical protein
MLGLAASFDKRSTGGLKDFGIPEVSVIASISFNLSELTKKFRDPKIFGSNIMIVVSSFDATR